MTEYAVEKSLHCGGWGQQEKAAVKELKQQWSAHKHSKLKNTGILRNNTLAWFVCPCPGPKISNIIIQWNPALQSPC